ncbi:dynein axonemal assembly factor 19 [Oratosquilla oratoria]|uniref:dynein axonemal assembly factor 19 n=1 Tax=Oratosquilla oratoria TaxID=337810 RepID=UPI003F76090B
MAHGGAESGLDPAQLEARLRAGIEADRRHSAENSTKLRAIHSAANYDEFRQLVMGTHLKPIDKGDKSKMRPSIWNSLASSASRKSTKIQPPDTENSVYPMDIHYDLNNPPTTTDGLVHLWENIDLAERLDLVRALNAQALERLASGLVAGGLLGDVITTLLAFTPTVSDVVMVVGVLQALTQAKRFSLSVQLVSGEERWAWGRLLEKLQLALSDRPQDLAELNVTEWTIEQLKLKFNL